MIGTNKNLIGDEEYPTNLTTPPANILNELFAKMVENGVTHCVMEVSSHALALKRTCLLDFDAAIFTNLTSDHMDFHISRENYLFAKKILFDGLKKSAVGVFNLDDSDESELSKDFLGKKISYGVCGLSDYQISDIKCGFANTNFKISFNGITKNLSTPLAGKFTAYNAVSALSAAIALDINIDSAIKGIENIKQIPGRFEVIKKENRVVIVDFSHTADSLRQALLSVNEIADDMTQRPQIITVFGCGGNKDRTKRPIMGSYASELSDRVIITSDNPRNEDPYEIIEEIKSGIVKENYIVVESREEAIKTAINESQENAVILIAGKGHEDYQIVNGVKSFFSDKQIAEKYLELC